MNRRTLINLIFFNGVFALMLFWAVNNIVTVDRLERPYTITGDFAQAAGVKANAEVTYLGVHHGRVTNVTRRPGGVHVTMKIDRDKDIPAGSIARVFRKSAIGEPYIDFQPPDSYDAETSDRIEPNENIPEERTTVPLEFSELLRSASALVSSIDPEAAGGLVHELALALDGRGESLRSLTTSMDQLTSTFAERTDQLDRLARNSTRVTRVLADHRLSFGRSIQNLRAVAETLRDADGDTKVLLDVGPDFLTVTADLVADQKRNLDCLLTDLAPVLRALAQPEQLDDLAQTLELSPLAFSYVAATVDNEADGPWVRVNLLAPTDGADPKVYVPKKELPAVPSVPACASTLTPASVYAASSTPGRDTSVGSGTPADASQADDAGDVLADARPLSSTRGLPLAALALVLLAGAVAMVHDRLPRWRQSRASRTR
jgi:phospholipid/cholesterol/gamma-HCH transport system substrate-binding protein